MKSYSPTAEFKPNEPGIYTGLSMKDYRAAPGISGSDLKTLMESPAKYARREPNKTTEAMEFGTLVNDLLLFDTHSYYVKPDTYPAPESEKKDAKVIDKPWSGNAGWCRRWIAEHADKPVIDKEGAHSRKMLTSIKTKVTANRAARELIEGSMHEVSVFARSEDHPYLRKGRLDGLLFNPAGTTKVVEVKTTLDASTRAFGREIMTRGYYKKAAYYRDLLHSLGISPVEFWFIAIEKGEHPRVNVRKLAERAMDKGDFDNDDALTLMQGFRLTNFWPDFIDDPQPGSNAEPTIDMPDYVYTTKTEDLLGMTEVPEEKE